MPLGKLKTCFILLLPKVCIHAFYLRTLQYVLLDAIFFVIKEKTSL